MKLIRRAFPIFILFLLIGCKVLSQPNLSMNKRAQKLYEKGLQSMQTGDLDQALEAFERALEYDQNFREAHIQIGSIAFNQNEFETSKFHLEKALDLSSGRVGTIPLTLARIAWMEDRYGDVAPWIEMFLEQSRINPALEREAIKLARDAEYMINAPAPVNLQIISLSGQINTELPEYLPSLSAEENFMVFTRRVNGQEDFYITYRQDSTWSFASPMIELNTRENEGAHCLSADGKLLVFTACNRRDGYGSCDLYFSNLRNGSWTTPRNMGADINSSSWDAQPSLSANGRELIFSSQRPGGKGDRDLWLSRRTASGWAPPLNLAEINSEGNDESPFLHADNQSLYFMSDGHPGYGGSDLFLSRREDANWTRPDNLGAPINTKQDEGALHIALSGEIGYFARAQIADIDIYEFDLPTGIRPLPATYALIEAIDGTSKQALNATIKVNNLTTGSLFEYAQTDPYGKLLLCMTLGVDYGIQVNYEGYTFFSANINLEERKQVGDPHRILAELWPVKSTGDKEEFDPIVLRNVFFESGQSALLEKSFPELNRLHEFLQEQPQIRIEIRGHTDNVGSDEENLKLSETRALSVRQFLVSKGISEDRLQVKGFGELQPVSTNETAEGRALNRRTEFVILQ